MVEEEITWMQPEDRGKRGQIGRLFHEPSNRPTHEFVIICSEVGTERRRRSTRHDG